MDDVTFFHNGPYVSMSLPLQRERTNAPVASYWWCTVLDDCGSETRRVLRGCRGRSLRCTVAFVCAGLARRVDERVLYLQRLLRAEHGRLRCAGERRRTAVGEVRYRQCAARRQADHTTLGLELDGTRYSARVSIPSSGRCANYPVGL